MADSENRGVKRKKAAKGSLTESTKKKNKRRDCRAYQQRRRDSMRSAVNIYEQFTRWSDFKTTNRVVDDEQAAQILLDHYESWKLQSVRPAAPGYADMGFPDSPTVRGLLTPLKHRTNISTATTSTPVDQDPIAPYLSQVSSIYGSDSNKVSTSDTEVAPSSSQDVTKKLDISHDQHDITNEQIELNVTVQRSDGSSCNIGDIVLNSESDIGEYTYQDDEDDSDYVPDSVRVNYQNINLDYDDLEVIGEDEDFEMIENNNDDEDIEKDVTEPDLTKDNVTNLLTDHLSIAFDAQLIALAKITIPEKCTTCNGAITHEIKHIGSSTLMLWTCSSGHKIKRWCSQPVVRKIRVGDFLLASNILVSGNNHRKIAMMFKFMNMGCVSESTFNRIQKHYCLPAITNFWQRMVETTLDGLRGQELILLGDGQNDSPGHCAQYLNYNVIEQSTVLLVHVNTTDKRETGGNSNRMEIVGFKKALASLEGDGQNIVEVVTDAHIQIKSYMAKEKPEIKHSNDIWHGAKSVTKQISKATLKTENKPLAVWTKDIVNHFWWCAKHCNNDVDTFKAQWRGVLHHVVNQHQWKSGDGCIEPKCCHELLPQDYNDGKWLKPGSKPHVALEKVVLKLSCSNLAKNNYFF